MTPFPPGEFVSSFVTDQHGCGDPQTDGSFFGTVKDTGIAVPALVGIGDLRHLLLFRAEEDVLGADVDTGTTGNATILINDGRHILISCSNPKFEYRISKQIRIFKMRNSKFLNPLF
jgi:hypothetical protein